MKFEKLKPHIWYLFLTITSTVFVIYNYKKISNLEALNPINIIFIIWLVLLIMPLFSEIELPGVKLKKEIANAKEELSSNLRDLRIDLIDLKINNNSSAGVYIGNDFLPNVAKLNALVHENEKEEVKNSRVATMESNEHSKNDKSIESESHNNFTYEPSSDSIFLFSVRSYIEQNLVDIASKLGFGENSKSKRNG